MADPVDARSDAPVITAQADLRWKLPLHVDRLACFIYDADNHMIVEIRGWGHLTGTGGLNLGEDEAESVQKARAALIVHRVNTYEVLVEALKHAERFCPCGARPESPHTHSHVPGCPIERALALAESRS